MILGLNANATQSSRKISNVICTFLWCKVQFSIIGISKQGGHEHDISIDELLSNEKGAKKPTDYLFESVTEYDIDEPKRYDMKFGGAKQFILSGYEGEKIRVRLASNTLSTLQNDFKVKIDRHRKTD